MFSGSLTGNEEGGRILLWMLTSVWKDFRQNLCELAGSPQKSPVRVVQERRVLKDSPRDVFYFCILFVYMCLVCLWIYAHVWICVHIYVQVHVDMCVSTWKGQMLTSGVFFNCFPLYLPGDEPKLATRVL